MKQTAKMTKRLLRLLGVVQFLLLAGLAMAQNITVKGRVLKDDGQPVQKASVLVKGTTNGTTTDDNGGFTISVPGNGTLVISAVDFVTKDVKINDRSVLTVELVAVDKTLGEVIVVGYGTQRKKDVTGAVVSVNEKALREVPVANLQQALIGRAAGLEIQTVGNQPGAGAQIRIRGIRSISGSNEPLFVVDGIPYDGTLNDINPDEVASIDVLKDASATAIYGSRGANGVVLITTKKGRSGETKISYNGYYGIGKAAYKYPVFNSQEYQAMRNLSPWTNGYMAEELNGIAQGRNTDWQDLMYDNSMRMDHNINVSGGANGNTFSLGGGYYKETTVMPGEDFTRYTLRGTIDTKVGRRIKIGLSTQNTVSIANGSQFVSGSAIFRTLAISPLMPAYNPDGSLLIMPHGNADDNNADSRYTPLLLKGEKTWVDKVRRLRTFNTLYGEYEIIKGLRYRINLGLNYVQQFGGQFRGADQMPAHPSFFRPGLGNIARVDNGETWGYTAENLLFYDRTIAQDHKISATAMYSVQETQTFNNFVQKDSITDDFVQFYNLALSTPINSSNTAIGGGEEKTALISYMGRVNYSFKDRYLLTLTYRRDGSSRLAPGNKWFDYPAVSTGWVISDEPFMSKIKPISTLKLRAGWGKTSNQSISPYQSKGLVNNNNGLPTSGSIGAAGAVIRYNFGPTIVTGYNVVTLPNPNLSWEFTTTTNIGLDFGLLNNRITGSMEYYNSKTKDILYNVTLPVTSGVAGAYATNVGEMENKGFEFSVSSLNYKSKSGFSWSTDLNLFFNNNKLLKLSSNVPEDVGSQLFVGHSMTAIYDYVNDGIWQTNEAAAAAVLGSVPGQIKLRDISGAAGKPDGIINSTYDRRVIGDMDADLQGGLTNRFSYKNFDLSCVINARFGGLLVSQVHAPYASYITVPDGKRNMVKVDYWTPTNPSNWFPMPSTALSSVSDAWRTLGYYDASYIRIRSINLGYTFGNKILSKIKTQSLRAYFTIDNVALLYSPFWEKTGVDPQATVSGERGVGGAYSNLRQNNNNNGALVVGLSTPPRRTFTFGLNLTL
ncbi:MAG TPA: TonB-dependent receptor [Chitinophagaceae bacterium]|jgi:TonB-linked SusC/RagA family outer membrane protein|nr:TonB-dependent receptor [Chitinophagaceae bacterium]HMU57208.1 TonB-dependent receptor [Chitinophagaceae bacterium]